MQTGDLIIYGGITLAGVLASQLTPSLVALHRRLERETGDMPLWADRLALAGSWLAGIAAATVAGYVLGREADALTGWIGAVWGGCGGIVGPQLWPSVRRLTVEAARRRVASDARGQLHASAPEFVPVDQSSEPQ